MTTREHAVGRSGDPVAIYRGTGEWLCFSCAQERYTPEGLASLLANMDNYGRVFIPGEGFLQRMDRAPRQPQNCYDCYADIE
jgi:hypothetical protein